MSAWLLITVITGVLIALRLISVAIVVWRERARASSLCAQMETAAASQADHRVGHPRPVFAGPPHRIVAVAGSECPD